MNGFWLKSVFFVVAVVFLIAGCGAKNVEVGYGSGPSGGGYKHKKGGPPPHAPAHGYRAKHRYRYYPCCSVYYDRGRRVYFYIEGGHWEVGASLPSRLRVGLGDSVEFELDTDRPYIYHGEHVKKYPPGQLKKKHKMK